MAVTVESPPTIGVEAPARTGPVLLVSNPNAGKTTLFNALTGLRAKTANFPGTTLDVRAATLDLATGPRPLYDMPGLYGLSASTAEEQIAVNALQGQLPGAEAPSLIILVLDSTNLVRNLYLAAQTLSLGTPVLVALNMMDLAAKAGIAIEYDTLSDHLGCPVVPIVARTGRGIPQLIEACERRLGNEADQQPPRLLRGTDATLPERVYEWARTVAESCATGPLDPKDRWTDRIDAWLTHPVGGIAAFLLVLFAVFYLIFSLATVPMDLIDGVFGSVSALVADWLPDGAIESLITNGVIAGVGGVLIFLPQVCILFACIALLEDSGYLARAACVVDKVLRRVGLPGKAFVPMLSAHACAIPAIMSARVVEDRNDRLITILVLPLMTCSARLPVYAMVTALLFPYSPLKGALVFTAAYVLGIVAALSMAFVFRLTMVRKPPAPLMIELPTYKWPSVKNALFTAYDRAILFIRKAGTVILALSIVLWWLMSYPQPPADTGGGAEEIAAQEVLSYSFAGQLGRTIEPVIAPLGFDWQIGVGIIASFAAREVVVSALSVIYGVGNDPADDSLLIDRLREARRPDGSPVFGLATSASLLVFYVLAMQCLPTQAVTRRETGSWGWAVLQLVYMTLLAYFAALVTFQGLSAAGFA